MATAPEASLREAGDRSWYIVGRWQEYEGEGRANLLRIAGIGAFYIVELLNYHGLDLGVVRMPQIRDQAFHQAVTALAVAWVMEGLAVFLSLQRQIFPASLKFLSTAGDLILLTALLMVAAGPRSPIIVAYFVILALATLRFSVTLVQFTTAGAIASYLFVLGYAAWFASRDIRVPRYHEIIVLLALGLTGITLGQIIRRARALADHYAQRLGINKG
jgi:hypothetical protein